MKIIVFLGPSLDRETAESILPNATYLPPARQADLLDAVRRHRPDVVALVDGFYRCVPTVWHKEILYALEQGIAVYGASSMGALRAAELAPFGMVGVGEIYQRYADGLLDDDEVALVHAGEEFGFRPLSEPMVNVRATLEHAVQEGVLDRALCRRLLKTAKAVHFTERTFRDVFRDLSPKRRWALERWARENYVDLKRRDAIRLLETLRGCDTQPKPTPEIGFELERTVPFYGMQQDRMVDGLSANQLTVDHALHAGDYEDTRFHGLNRHLAQVLADFLGVEATPDDVAQEERRFVLLRRIANVERWIEDNSLDSEGFRDLMRQRAVCRKLHRWVLGKGSRAGALNLLEELRLAGHFPEVLRAARARIELVEAEAPDFPHPDYDEGATAELVLEQLRTTAGRMTIHFPQWSAEAGFADSDYVRRELIRARLARRAALRLLSDDQGVSPDAGDGAKRKGGKDVDRGCKSVLGEDSERRDLSSELLAGDRQG